MLFVYFLFHSLIFPQSHYIRVCVLVQHKQNTTNKISQVLYKSGDVLYKYIYTCTRDHIFTLGSTGP